jgi:O-acetyl-ADP-ribose deacetylase (regulator of RNase III)
VGVKDCIHIVQGDLTEQDAGAIVNAANNDLQLGGGVAGAIRRKGGPSIQAECDQIGPIALGEVAVTGGGRLKAHFVIHAASMSLGGETREEDLLSCTRHAMERAGERGLRSIAFPAIGTGIADFPMRRCAEVMLAEILQRLRQPTTVEDVRVVLFDRAAYETFLAVFEALPE